METSNNADVHNGDLASRIEKQAVSLENTAHHLEEEAARIKQEAQKLEAEAKKIERDAVDLHAEAEKLERQTRSHIPPAPIRRPEPRPVHQPRVHGWRAW